MVLDLINRQLGWPESNDVLDPPGTGTRVFVQIAREKILRELRRISGDDAVQIGVLATNPSSATSEPPLGLVCEFSRPTTADVLALAHALAWNFCHCPILVTLEPHLVRLWDCCQPPVTAREDAPLFHSLNERNRAEIFSAPLTNGRLSDDAAEALSWMNMATGQLIRQHQPKGYFRREGRADYLLLKNLKGLRRRLTTRQRDKEPAGGVLPAEVCHDLLARLIFVEFLFQRKDSDGGTALNVRKLGTLYEAGVLRTRHATLVQILRDRGDTYRLFRWLNEQFNGDIFPSGATRPSGAPSPLEKEKAYVKAEHLAAFADFIEGRIDEASEERFLWSQYRFDVIPLEFISSVYEDFVGRSKGVHFTPLHLVDFVLDRVLPWGGEGWDFRVLDPACGSGIFLVKAFQRLIYRWRSGNPGKEPDASLLRQLLERNLLGIDINAEAVRVAAFSLYLAMIDEIDPRKVWTTVKFPLLNNHRLLAADFFSETSRAHSTRDDIRTFDFVVGNAPWGKRTTTELAEDWADNQGWSVANLDIGPLFLAKALTLLKPAGKVAMIQPLGALLLNDTENARSFRGKLFQTAQLHEVVNLSTLRFDIFANAVWPCCIVYAENRAPTEGSIVYICPKGGLNTDGSFRLRIEPSDIHQVRHPEAMSEPIIWTALIWGQRRDLALLRRLREFPSIAEYRRDETLAIREGIIRGKKAKRYQEFLVGKKWMSGTDFPKDPLKPINAAALKPNADYETDKDASIDFSAFAIPQLIIKQSWHQPTNRFQAALVETTSRIGPVLCPDSYVSATSAEDGLLKSMWAMLNSRLAVYFLLLTSGQFAAGIPKPLEKEMRALPIPDLRNLDIGKIKSLGDIDRAIRGAFQLNEAECALIDDLFEITLKDFKGGQDSAGRLPTARRIAQPTNREEPQLMQYCKYLLRVLRATFGEDKGINATIFQERPGLGELPLLPLRMVAIHFDTANDRPIRISRYGRDRLREEIERTNSRDQANGSQGGVYTHSVARLYTSTTCDRRKVPTLFLLKPDQRRYWSRSAALHDGDLVVADFGLAGWRVTSRPSDSHGQSSTVAA